MQWQSIVASTIGTLVVLFPIAFIWYLNINGIGTTIKSKKKAKLLEKAIPDLTCSINADCPAGFVCIEGRCVPEKV
jgi:hypothetical protein